MLVEKFLAFNKDCDSNHKPVFKSALRQLESQNSQTSFARSVECPVSAVCITLSTKVRDSEVGTRW